MTFQVLVDWDRDGSVGGIYPGGIYPGIPLGVSPEYGEDVTALVRREDQVSLRYGRDQDTAIAPVAVGQGAFTLSNRDRRFSPRNTASPLYGKVKPARPVRITRTVGGVTYTLFQGLTDDSPITPDPDSKSVALALIDALASFNGTNITTGLHRDLRTGDAIGLILDQIGWTGGRDLDPGATVIPWWWEDDGDALTALNKVVQSEGQPALLTVGSDGEIVFRDRHHRLTRASSLTSQGTWRDKGTLEPVMGRGFSYEESWRNIINTGTASVDVRRPQDVQPVWTSDTTITLSAGEQKMVTATASDPFFAAVVPELGTDFTTSAGSVSVALLTTDGLSATIVLTAIGGVAIVNNLQLRAIPVSVSHTVQVSASDLASIDEFGRKSFPNDLPWCGPEDAEAILETVVAQRAWPVPVVTARFVCGNITGRSAAVLARDLSDRVRVVETETLLDADFYLESITHEFSGDHDHAVTFGLEGVTTPVSSVLRFDNAGQGFGQGKFGTGVDDPVNMLRFDSTSGHRFDEGVFAG